MTTIVATESTYWLATDHARVAHFGHLQVDQQVTTGQPSLTAHPTMDAIVALLVEDGFPIMDGSTHPLSEWYLWSTKAEADAALTAINSASAFPILVPDPATGENTVSVASWCSKSRQTQDGRWGFPRIPTDILDEWNVSLESRAAWLAAFQPAIVTDPS